MSKSKGNVVDPNVYVDKYGYKYNSYYFILFYFILFYFIVFMRTDISRVDPIRYFLLNEGGLMHDGDWSDSELESKYRSHLADTLGNLFSRCTAATLYPSNSWPCVYIPSSDPDKQFMDSIQQLPGIC
jgi:methionyl-tRNA synthetase